MFERIKLKYRTMAYSKVYEVSLTLNKVLNEIQHLLTSEIYEEKLLLEAILPMKDVDLEIYQELCTDIQKKVWENNIWMK